MSIEEWPKGILVVKGDILEYAKKLFNKREYFGAFARIHSLIEFWMQNLYELDYVKKHGPFKVNELIKRGYRYEYRYDKLRKRLLKAELINSDDAERIKDFGDLRNRIMHRLVKYSFQTYDWHIVKKDEVIRGFDEGVALVNLLSARCNHQVSMTVVFRLTNQPPSNSTQK